MTWGRRDLVRGLTWPLAPALVAGTGVAGARAGMESWTAACLALLGVLACWAVGVVVTWRSAEQPAGWAFLGLGTALAWSSFADEYAPAGDPHPLPGYRLIATLSDTSFVWWFVFVALVLQCTPTRSREGRLASALPAVTLVCGGVFQVLALLRSTPLDPPYQGVSSPWAVELLRRPAALGAAVAIYLLAACVLLSFVQLVRAWRGSRGEARRQLLWLVAAAIPVPPVVVAAFVFSRAGDNTVSAILLGTAIVCLVVGAAFSVLRYRLYDVERVVTESAAYAIASVAVLLIVGGVALVISRSTPLDARSQVTTAAATLLGAAAARTSYVWGARAVGRRVNRTRFDAVETLRAGLADPRADLDALVSAALGDRARVVYPSVSGTWVTADGREAVPRSEQAYVEVRRRGVVAARLEYDEQSTEPEVARAVADAAAPEIDNVALRAELARQVEVVTESRARLATAHLEERRRIERDLHDGAQQRLLAMALQLQAARLNGEVPALTREVDRVVSGLAETVQELRDLAAGLQPAALAGGGVLAAVIDLAGRIPLRLELDVPDVRLPERIEAAAWFVIAEGVANVVKHAQAEGARITVRPEGAAVRVVVSDQGRGGADPRGRGLSGLADRVAALRGTLQVRPVEPHGTELEAVLPCAS
jgi:signal transduction histidine kinase